MRAIPSFFVALVALVALVAVGVAGKVLAATPVSAPAPATAGAADPRVELAAKLSGVKPEELRASPIPGIYELSRGAEVTYVTADGQFIFIGDLYRVAKSGEFPNLSDARRRELRLKLLAKLSESQMIVFSPAQPKYTVTVFTDPECPWCRKLHSQIAEYNRLGIKVRYAFFPREGMDSDAARTLDAVWCSADRKEALTRAKLGQPVKAAACGVTPVRLSWELGHQIGVESTPNMVLEDGELIPGYLPPRDLLAKLAPQAAKAASSPAAPPASLAR
jgi:thiol:disulfide interchange protein DsbC